MRRRTIANKKGFTLIEVMVALIVSTILILGMGSVLVTLFGGMRESADFAEATGRVDLIRQLTFDARTGEEILFPAVDGPGDYTGAGVTGDQIQFTALYYDPTTETTTPRRITWESVRSSTASPTDPYTVNRWVDFGSGDTLTFAQDDVLTFEIVRTSNDNFTAEFSASEGDEQVAVELAVTLRNVVQ